MILSGIADECAANLEEQLRMHRTLGWSHIEIRNINDSTIDTLDDESFHKAAEALANSGIHTSALASDVGKLWLDGDNAQPFQADVDTLATLIARAKRLACRFIRVMGYRAAHLPDVVRRDEAVARLKHLSGMARDQEVFLLLENCVGWHARSGRKMCEFLDRVDSEHLLCLYDTGNPVTYGRNVEEFYSAVRERIAYIHIKDAVKAGGPFTFPGDGAAKICHVLEDQCARGYRGFVSIEPHLGPSAHRPNVIQNLGQPWETYHEYGKRLTQMLAEVTLKRSS